MIFTCCQGIITGIFYDVKNDEIFIVKKIYPKTKWAILKKGSVVGFDEQWTYDIEYKKRKIKRTLIKNMHSKNIVLLEKLNNRDEREE